MRRVVVTGMGVITSLGMEIDKVWTNVLSGKMSVSKIKSLNESKFLTTFASEVNEFEPKKFIKKNKKLRMMSRGDQMCYLAAMMAVKDANMMEHQLAPDRLGLFVGGNKEVMSPPEDIVDVIMNSKVNNIPSVKQFGENAREKVHPLFFIKGLPAASLFYISEELNYQGPNSYFMGTANVSSMAIGSAFRAIKYGEADVALAGGFSEPFHPWSYIKLDSIGVLNRDTEGEVGKSYRPFDVHRNGAYLGEGSTMLFLEEMELAIERGVNIYGEIVGFGNGFDVENTLTPSRKGEGLQVAMRKAIRESTLETEEIDYICAHGSGTKLGDDSEIKAVQAVFSDNHTPLSSVKPTVGHMISNAGAFNAYISLMTLRDQIIPYTVNCSKQEPSWNARIVMNQPYEKKVKNVISLARGLEGQNSALVFSAF